MSVKIVTKLVLSFCDRSCDKSCQLSKDFLEWSLPAVGADEFLETCGRGSPTGTYGTDLATTSFTHKGMVWLHLECGMNLVDSFGSAGNDMGAN